MGIKTSTTFDLNIIICGKATYQQVSLLFGETEKPLDEEYYEIKGKNYKIKHNKILDWKYFIMSNEFNDEIINKINEIIIDSYDLYLRKNLIIGFLTKDETIKLLKSFNKFHENYYPFFIIIPNNHIENQNEENNFNIININTEFDENFNMENLLKSNDIKINIQNIFIQNWQEKIENNQIISTIFKICSYYNELGDSIILPKNCGFNIENNINNNFNKENYKIFITVGGTGVGKSTFINLFLQEKKSLCGEGFSQTSKIVKYIHKNLPVFIYDTPGFTLGKNDEVKVTLDAIKDLIYELNSRKKNIDIIFYLINSQSGRTLQGIEFEILKFFVKMKIKIFFVLTRVFNKIQGEQFKIEFENSLNVLFKDDKNVIVQSLVENVYLVDLKNEKTCEKLIKNIYQIVFDNNNENKLFQTPISFNKDNNISNEEIDINNNNNNNKEKNKVFQIIEKLFK